jgi:predicted phage terminase large subunit-like protein
MVKPRLTRWVRQTPTIKQTALLLLSDVLEVFWGGAGGCGKSRALLMAAAQWLDVPGYSAVIFRNKFTDLMKPDGLIPASFEWWYGDEDAEWNGEQKQWSFRCPGGGHSTLAFSYLDGPNDQFSHQSASYQYVAIDEAVNIRETQALYMFTRMRRLETHKHVPLRFRVASNPPAREQLAKGAWVKRRYVNPKTRTPGAIFIPALMDDNPYLDKDSYRESLSHADPITRRQIELGDWEIQATGRMVEREHFKFVDVAPADCKWVRYWDMASTEPTPQNREPDYTAGVLMGRSPIGYYYVKHAVRWRKAPGPTEVGIRHWAETDGIPVPVWMEIEPGSGGINTISHYMRHVLQGFNFRGNKVTTSKTARFAPFASQAEAGNVYLIRAPWNDEYLESAVVFPDGAHDDLEDATSGAFSRLCAPISLVR